MRVLSLAVFLTAAVAFGAVRFLAAGSCEPVSQELFTPTLVNGPDTAEEALADFLASPTAGEGPAEDMRPDDFASSEGTPSGVVFRSSRGNVKVVLDYVTPNLDEGGWYVSDVAATC